MVFHVKHWVCGGGNEILVFGWETRGWKYENLVFGWEMKGVERVPNPQGVFNRRPSPTLLSGYLVSERWRMRTKLNRTKHN